MLRRLFLCILVCQIGQVFGQPKEKKTDFHLTADIIGKDTQAVVFTHADQFNRWHDDTIKLKEGKFSFSGKVNGACEALLWTDLKNLAFDNRSVIHFLLEPGDIDIKFLPVGPDKALISGSQSQTEKEKWDDQKAPLLIPKMNIEKSLDSLQFLMRTDSINARNQFVLFAKKWDSAREKIRIADIGYLIQHPNSYLSALFLNRYRKLLPVDSMKIYYNSLSENVKQSSVGHEALREIYPLTDDASFRAKNPLIDGEFTRQLESLSSVYDLTLKDSSDKPVSLSSFRGKYLVIDFWASWCGPCVENIPFLKRIMKAYSPDSVQFISISLDYDPKAWKAALVRNKFGGIQFDDTAAFKSLAAVYCKVTWVPKYLIADKQGHIITYNAPHPGEPEFQVQLNSVLRRDGSNKKGVSGSND